MGNPPDADARVEPAEESPLDTEFQLIFVLEPDGFRHRVLAAATSTLKQLKDQVTTDLKLTPGALKIPELDDACAAHGYDAMTFTLAHAGLIANNDQEILLHASVVQVKVGSSEYKMPDAIDVSVYSDAGQLLNSFPVQILKFTGKKPYLGGFRHKISDQIFHHASAQTVVSKQKVRLGPPRFHRETQTRKSVTKSAQTQRESGTQMDRIDVAIDSSLDREVLPKPYFNAEQLECLRMDSCLILQCHWRAYRARCFVHAIRAKKLDMCNSDEKFANETRVSLAARQRKEIDRRMHPQSHSDFEVLYNELDNWRLFEISSLDVGLSGEARAAAMAAILTKETKLLQTIDRLKMSANETNRKARIESMLTVLSRPKQWQMSDGQIKPVETPFTIRAKELSDLYHGLKLPLATVDERLDVLLHVKWTVKEFESALTRELIELIDREADMLNRGRSVKSLEGLRKRISNLFLQFVETPAYNPEAASLQHVLGNTPAMP
ncbi:hypothetical protein SDRG_16385 [Saprolegnia diclina VS20]|uniref:IQ motif and ubiquitin-like domain-containing protein n=1 Tax=Saprolegnia diclina (strain VS20) TaxID=1156394 RepID=T0PK76_SAPDV|nr:hypothetical protein SDRG_16385 [Saprolegnia diclina VS20]EQC25789.1 hypothetical protein SDRG_16385 [Saprolegnia diclina VS20]|eukprot:XP_008620814.1 hypothetical protein SDRG_16385 [Saprolegnia diclina VS20]